VSDDVRALAVWPDTRAGTRVSLKQDLARRVVAFSQAEGLGSGTKLLLRAGGVVLLLAGLALLVLVALRRGPFRMDDADADDDAERRPAGRLS
jgi:hypothetical protein